MTSALQPGAQPDLLVVLDFEATCDEGHTPSPQEIIEFPSVLVRLPAHAPVDEFESFVRPQHHPRLSAFCRDLTGIGQREVDQAAPFAEVLDRYLAWLRSHGLAVTAQHPPGPSWAIATCGDWDLATMFPNQCRDAVPPQPLIPRPFRRWVNVKALFARWRGTEKAPGMPGMLDALDLPLLGRHHRGIDDCRNIARIVAALAGRGVPIVPTTELPVSRHPPLAVQVRLGAQAAAVGVTQRSLAALLERSAAQFNRPVRCLRHGERALRSDEDLLDVPSGATLDAEGG